MPNGSWRWMFRFHSCTVGTFSFGSNTPTSGAIRYLPGDGERKLTGDLVGAGSESGKPCPILRLASKPGHPPNGSCPTVVRHCVTRPGTLPLTDVTWKLESGSNAMP